MVGIENIVFITAHGRSNLAFLLKITNSKREYFWDRTAKWSDHTTGLITVALTNVLNY